MASGRIQRRIDRLLDQIEDAADQLDWRDVRERSEAVLAYDPENQDALSFLVAAQRAGNVSELRSNLPSDRQPTSFANGRYEVKRFLGEGGKKKVYLSEDTLLDRIGLDRLRLFRHSSSARSSKRPRAGRVPAR